MYVCRYSVELVIHITNITLNRYCHSYGIEQQNQRISNEGCYAGTTSFIFQQCSRNIKKVRRIAFFLLLSSPSLFRSPSCRLPSRYEMRFVNIIALSLSSNVRSRFPMRTQIIHDLNRVYHYRVCLNFCLEYRYYKYYDGEKDIKKWGRFLPCSKCMLNHLHKNSFMSNNIKQVSPTHAYSRRCGNP